MHVPPEITHTISDIYNHTFANIELDIFKAPSNSNVLIIEG